MKFKLVYIVHGVVVLLLLTMFIVDIDRLIDSHYFTYYPETSLRTIWSIIVTRKLFISILILVISTVGIFVKSKIGWVLVTQYLYFLFWNMFFQSESSDFMYIEFFIFIIVLGLSIIGLILILNLKKSSLDYYKIEATNLLGYNIVSFVIGFSISYLLFYYRNLYYLV